MSPNLELLPAIDVKSGKSVRISKSGQTQQTSMGSPSEIALEFQAAGASWIHLVDLDAAYGIGSNSQLLTEVISQLDIDVQLSGGITDSNSLHRAMDSGCRRVNLSAAALADMKWIGEAIQEFGDRVAIGIDITDLSVTPRGTNLNLGSYPQFIETLNALDAPRYIVTDTQRDGALLGPNLGLLDQILECTDRPVIASGGVSTLLELRELKKRFESGLEGVIVGKALYEGKFQLTDALAECAA